MNIDKCPRCGLRHSSEDCPSTMAAFHLSRMDPDYSAPAAPQAPSGQPCTVCGTPYEKHGSYPTCATHPYTPSGQQAEPTDQQILHRWDTHVGDPMPKYSLTDADKIRFARAVLALAGQQSERPAPAGQAVGDTARLNFLRDNSCDLKCFDVPTGQGDADVHWQVVEHHMAEPREREIGRAWRDEPRDAIDDAMSALAASQAERPAVKEGDRA